MNIFPGSGALLALALALTTPVAWGAPRDSAATSLSNDAMDGDYLAMRFKEAEQKLKKALTACGKEGCSAAVQGRLHRDLAVVYVAGLKKQDKGKKEMEAAITAHPSLQLNPDFATPDVKRAFAAAGGVEREARPEQEPAPKSSAELQVEERAASEAAPVAQEPAPANAFRLNWLSLAFQQDLLMYQETTNVCTGAAQYQCFLDGQSFTGPVYDRSGNQLSGGVGFATKRVLLGYERLLGENLTLGVRAGFAFGGGPKATNGGGDAFSPFHAELRGSYWFGESPFGRSGLRAFAGAAVGIADVDGHVAVEYYADEAGYLIPDNKGRGKLDAWRKTGNSIVGLHGGIAIALREEHALLLELRIVQMVGQTAIGGAVSIGYAFGL